MKRILYFHLHTRYMHVILSHTFFEIIISKQPQHSNSSLLLSLWSSSKYNCQNYQYCFLLSLFWGFELLICIFLVRYYCKNAKLKIRGKKNLSNNVSLGISFFFPLCVYALCLFKWTFVKEKSHLRSILHCKEEKILK